MNITSVSTFRVPRGTWISEGTAAAQGAGYAGGGIKQSLAILRDHGLPEQIEHFNYD